MTTRDEITEAQTGPAQGSAVISVRRVAGRAKWLAVGLGSLMLLLILPATVFAGDPLGGLTDPVTEVTDEVLDPVTEVTDEVVDPVVETVEPVVQTVVETAEPAVEQGVATAVTVADDVVATTEPLVSVADPLLASVPDVAAQVELTLPLVEAGVVLGVGTDGGGVIDTGLDLDLTLPILGDTDVSIDTGVDAGGLLPGSLPGGVNLPADPPGGLGTPTAPGAIGPPVGGWSGIGPPTPGTAVPSARAVPGYSNHAPDPTAPGGAFERLARELGRGFIGQGGGVALGGALALLTVLALVPPLTRGGLLPASAFWRPVRFVSELDPPG